MEDNNNLNNTETIEEKTKVKPKIDKDILRKRLFWIRLPIFVAIMLMLLTYAIYVLTPKYPYGICSMYNFYRQPENSVDVLAIGTSLSYTDLSTAVLWNEYGIACYDLGTAEQPYWSGYYYLVEALKYQRPKVILIDAKACTYKKEPDRTRTILCTYGILDPINRIKAIIECAGSENALQYILAFSQIHTNYKGLKTSDFSIPPSNGDRGSDWKGNVEKAVWAEKDTPDLNFTESIITLDAHEEKYFRMILQLCADEQIPTVIIGYPNADYKNDHLAYNTAETIGLEYGIYMMNYNLPEYRTMIDYQYDCADWQHLNVKGSVAFTTVIGEDLLKWFDLEDHRGDEYYESYQRMADDWYNKYPQYVGTANDGAV